MVGAARCLVEHFKKSELASSKLRESRLLEQRWPVTATLSDSSFTQRGKRYLDLKSDQWSLLEELSTVLKPFECVTVFISGQKYATISAIPPLVKGLLKSTQSAVYESLRAFQLTAVQQLQERWKRETAFSDGAPNTVILAMSKVLTYFGEKSIAKEETPLLWWKANNERYPMLARLAKSYLCIPATSTPSERLFSAAGNIASKKRASLSQEHVDMLTFLHCNAKAVSEQRE